jgi:hypothetical protein
VNGIKNMHQRSIIENFLSEKDAEEFAEWAFGENFREILRPDLVLAWNNLHSHQLILSSDGRPSEDIPKMIEIWRNRNE